jgi:hypothetical protein
MQAVGFSKSLVTVHQTTRRHIPGHHNTNSTGVRTSEFHHRIPWITLKQEISSLPYQFICWSKRAMLHGVV